MLVIVAPGQGSQAPGFLSPWLDLAPVAARLAWMSAVADLDLVRHGTVSDAQTIRDTAVAQPLIVAAALAAAPELFADPADESRLVGAVAGHSVGELAAAALAGVISVEQAMVLVRERGRAMAAASAVRPTGMTALVGGDPEEVRTAIEAVGATAANVNGAGQIVAAGTAEQLAALAEKPPARTRVLPLSVAGAFHTHHMAPAVDVLARYVAAIDAHDARTRLLSNADGTVVHDGREVLDRLVRQVASPVRWDLCMQTLADLGASAVIELPPAGTLTGLIRRTLPGVQTLALKTPDDLPAARELVARHATPTDLAATPTWRVVVSPTAGTFARVDAATDQLLAPGTTVGTVITRRDRVPVVAPHGGTVIEWLAEDGDPVAPGQPLLRLHPTSATS